MAGEYSEPHLLDFLLIQFPKILEPAKQTCLLGPFATAEGFNRESRRFLGGHGTLRVGVDIR